MGAFVMRMRYLTLTTCALLVLAAPGLGWGSGTLREGALSVRLAAVTTQQSLVSAASSNSWTATASMSTARGSLTATRLTNGRVLVVGGAGESTTELYDSAGGAWLAGGSLNEPRGL